MAEAPLVRDYGSDVEIVAVGGREFVLVGTAHVSRESAELVRDVIERERPDCVCIELDRQRYAALSQPHRFSSLDLREVIRERQLAALLVNLLLAAWQRRLGGALGVLPGSELLAAANAADALGIPVELCDRDVRVTLRRAWASMGLWRRSVLLAQLLAGALERPELSEEDLRRLRERDVLSELMRELGEALPELKRVLIDERDAYLAQRMRSAPGTRIVAVVGAGHVAGMREALARAAAVDLAPLEAVPPGSRLLKWLGWGVPAALVVGFGVLGATRGWARAGDGLLYYFLATGIPTSIGAIASLGHPATVAVAFLCPWLTGLIPVIGAGHVCAFVQAVARPPRVRDFESVADDAVNWRRWWQSRLLRIFLVFLLTTLGASIGLWVGGYGLITSLFGGTSS